MLKRATARKEEDTSEKRYCVKHKDKFSTNNYTKKKTIVYYRIIIHCFSLNIW